MNYPGGIRVVGINGRAKPSIHLSEDELRRLNLRLVLNGAAGGNICPTAIKGERGNDQPQTGACSLATVLVL